MTALWIICGSKLSTHVGGKIVFTHRNTEMNIRSSTFPSLSARPLTVVKPVTCCHLVVSFVHKPQTGAGDSRDVDNEAFKNSKCNEDEWCEKTHRIPDSVGRKEEAEPLPCSWTPRQLFLSFVTAQWYFLVCCSPLFLLHYSHLIALQIKMWMQNTREASEWSYICRKTRETRIK